MRAKLAACSDISVALDLIRNKDLVCKVQQN